MRSFLVIFLIGLHVAGAWASESSVKKIEVRKSELQTDVRFNDSVLHGRYQTPTEAMAKVENEKVLKDLIGIRKHFKDRLLKAAEQE